MAVRREVRVFLSLTRNNNVRRYLCTELKGVRDKLSCALENYEPYEITLRPFQLQSVLFGTTFSNARMVVGAFNYDEEGNPCNPEDLEPYVHSFFPTIKFSVLYKKGFDVLKDYCDRGEVEEQYKPWIRPLLLYLDELESHEESLRIPEFLDDDDDDDYDYQFESHQSAVIANHLLSKLVQKEGYILSNSKRKVTKCPCPVDGCKNRIKFGNTSIGYEKMWYGKPDIVLYPAGISKTSVVTQNNPNWVNINNGEKTQIFEMKAEQSNVLRKASTTHQCIAQAITFSLYQRNFAKRIPSMNITNVSLIPTISITLNSFDIYMYDHVNDVLLRNHGEPIDLWQRYGKKLNIVRIIQMWLATNHILFEAQLNKRHIKKLGGTCDFHRNCGDKLETFRDRVHFISSLKQRPTSNYSIFERELSLDSPAID